MNKIANLLRTNRILRFFSSVKLAVPLMIVIGIVVAVGTVYESMYNSEYARILIYQTLWFFALTVLLWINICFAMLSRWPFQKRHIGFVLTHIGLMTLLIGGSITGFFGIDGQLRVTEGESSSTVILPSPIIGYQFKESPSAQSIDWPRRISAFTADQNSSVNSDIRGLFWVSQYIPFSSINSVMAEGPGDTSDVGLSFKLKSQFFDVSEWLHSKSNPSMKMGPATLALKLGKPGSPTRVPQTVSGASEKKRSSKSSSSILIKDAKEGRLLGEVQIDQLQKQDWTNAGVTIHLKRMYRFAVVGANKLSEGSGPEENPALEFEIKKGGQVTREVLFYKFKNFSLNKDGAFGVRLELSGTSSQEVSSSTVDLPPGHPPMPTGTQEPVVTTPVGGNIVEFWVDPLSDNKRAIVVLKKNNMEVGRAEIGEGQLYQTPWMGMTITLASIVIGGAFVQQAIPVQPQKGGDLPPSAVKVQLADGSKSFWLVEGSVEEVTLMNRSAQIFYGRKVIDLPFSVHLKKFTKYDYPGTDTAMSYESLVEVDKQGSPILISMNEPLKRNGFTLYQSSYVLQPGQPPDSIFSVNRDPGRLIKYAGSIILAFGIILFTLMRSRWWTKKMSARS